MRRNTTNGFPMNKNIYAFGGKHHKVHMNNPVLAESTSQVPVR